MYMHFREFALSCCPSNMRATWKSDWDLGRSWTEIRQKGVFGSLIATIGDGEVHVNDIKYLPDIVDLVSSYEKYNPKAKIVVVSMKPMECG